MFVAEPYTRGIGGGWQRTRLCSEAFIEAIGAEIELPNIGTQKRPPGAMDDGDMFLDSRRKIKIKTAAGGQETWNQEGKTNYMTIT